MADQLDIIADQHAATGAGDDFVAIEGEDRRAAERASRFAAVAGTEGFGGILDQGHSMARAGGDDWLIVGALAIEIDHHHRFG